MKTIATLTFVAVSCFLIISTTTAVPVTEYQQQKQKNVLLDKIISITETEKYQKTKTTLEGTTIYEDAKGLFNELFKSLSNLDDDIIPLFPLLTEFCATITVILMFLIGIPVGGTIGMGISVIIALGPILVSSAILSVFLGLLAPILPFIAWSEAINKWFWKWEDEVISFLGIIVLAILNGITSVILGIIVLGSYFICLPIVFTVIFCIGYSIFCEDVWNRSMDIYKNGW